MGYTKWDNFLNVIEKAKKAAENSDISVNDHFADISKMVPLGSGAEYQGDKNLVPLVREIS